MACKMNTRGLETGDMKLLQAIFKWGFPGGTVDKSLPCNTWDTGSIPSPGRFHMPRSTTLLKPRHLELVLHSKSSHHSDPHTTTKSSPHLRNWGKPTRSNEDPA